MRNTLRVLGVAAIVGLGAQSSQAQSPVVYRYDVPVPPRTYVVAPQPRTYVVAPAPAYRQRMFAPRRVRYAPSPVYYQQATPFVRYRTDVDAGRDPNWATGRGVPLYKPWEY